MDLFGWATAGVRNPDGVYGADETQTAYYPWAYSTDNTVYGPSLGTLPALTSWMGQDCEPYCEWGRNSNLETWLGEGWRTLSKEEWEYLLGSAEDRFYKACVDGYNGLILFPDNYSVDYDIFDSSRINAPSASFIYVDESISSITEDGLVFLPACGLREGVEVSEVDSMGAYWSSTPAEDSEDAYALSFDGDGLTLERFGRGLGISVRLVRDVE